MKPDSITLARDTTPALAQAIDGERSGANWLSGGGWHSGASTLPQWLQVDFNGSKTISEVDVFTVQDNSNSPAAPTESLTFSLYGLSAFEVQYWDGSAWAVVPGGSITGNNKVWRRSRLLPSPLARLGF